MLKVKSKRKDEGFVLNTPDGEEIQLINLINGNRLTLRGFPIKFGDGSR